MKCYFIFFLLFAALGVDGQTFTINSSGTILPAVDGTKFKSITFIVDKAFINKKFEIFLEDGTTLVNVSNSELGPELSRNPNDLNYTITVGEDHKILGCNGCLNVTDKFTVKLDGKLIGNFNLVPYNPDVDQVIAEDEIYRLGSIVDDALFIAAAIESKTKAGTIKKILATEYKITSSAELDANHYLKTELAYVFSTTPQGGLSLQSIGSSVGGLDVTNIADGFAKFIVKRTKEELSIAFFQKFKEELDNYKDLNTLFPKTHGLLMVIDQEIYIYSNYINNLREAFRADIKILDENLPRLIDNHEAFFSLDKNYIYKVSLLSGCYVSRSLKHDQHPADILQGFPLHYFEGAPASDQPKIDALKGSIQTLQLFSESLKDSDPAKNQYWVSVAKLRGLVENPLALKIYIGLLIEVAKNKYNKIPYSHGVDLYTQVNTAARANAFDTDYPQYKQFVITVGAKVDQLNKMIKDFDDASSDSLKVEKYARYFKATVEFIQTSTEVANLPALAGVANLASIAKGSEAYFEVAYQVTDLVSAINRKRYPEAINNLILIYNTIYVNPALDQLPRDPEKLTNKEKLVIADNAIAAAKNNSGQAIGPIVNTNAQVAKKIQDDDPTLHKAKQVSAAIAKYGAFMANMIDAKNSDEVADAIESVALPVGSASIKRHSAFNVSLNAYCGLFVGNEIIKDLDPNKPLSRFNSFGLTAPIGIAISKGNSFLPWPLCLFDKGDSGFSSSLFMSLIDLGAVAAFRFQDTTTEQVPSIQLKDIFSPGIFWSLGIPKTPVSINLGVQVGPNLRKVTGDENNYSDKTYARYSIAVCVDLPLLNIYSKSKK